MPKNAPDRGRHAVSSIGGGTRRLRSMATRSPLSRDATVLCPDIPPPHKLNLFDIIIPITREPPRSPSPKPHAIEHDASPCPVARRSAPGACSGHASETRVVAPGPTTHIKQRGRALDTTHLLSSSAPKTAPKTPEDHQQSQAVTSGHFPQTLGTTNPARIESTNIDLYIAEVEKASVSTNATDVSNAASETSTSVSDAGRQRSHSRQSAKQGRHNNGLSGRSSTPRLLGEGAVSITKRGWQDAGPSMPNLYDAETNSRTGAAAYVTHPSTPSPHSERSRATRRRLTFTADVDNHDGAVQEAGANAGVNLFGPPYDYALASFQRRGFSNSPSVFDGHMPNSATGVRPSLMKAEDAPGADAAANQCEQSTRHNTAFHRGVSVHQTEDRYATPWNGARGLDFEQDCVSQRDYEERSSNEGKVDGRRYRPFTPLREQRGRTGASSATAASIPQPTTALGQSFKAEDGLQGHSSHFDPSPTPRATRQSKSDWEIDYAQRQKAIAEQKAAMARDIKRRQAQWARDHHTLLEDGSHADNNREARQWTQMRLSTATREWFCRRQLARLDGDSVKP